MISKLILLTLNVGTMLSTTTSDLMPSLGVYPDGQQDGNRSEDYDITPQEVWTQWFNTDDATSFGGDDESVTSIRKRGFEVCTGYNIISAQCRVVGSPTIFSENTIDLTEGLDVLYRPCTSGGLYCRNQDQSGGNACQDYTVRFRCTTGSVTDEVVYTWVAVLAVVFLVIPIVWVVVINLKRKYCPSAEERSRNSAVNSASGTSVSTLSDGATADPPPSYDELFGGGSPLGSPTLGFGSTTALLENELPQTRIPTNSGDFSESSQVPGSLNNNFVQISERPGTHNFSNNVHGSNSLTNVPRTSIFPGMHLPVFTIMRQISAGQITPPPTYDDALVALGVALPKKDNS